MKTFLENKYAKKQKEENERARAAKTGFELERQLVDIVNQLSNVSHTTENPELAAREQQAEVFFRKALRDVRKGIRFLR